MGRRTHAFTLIELLVAIAVVALLVAIMIPVLGKARERGKTVVCASDMRQMGQITMNFATEFDGRGPGRAMGGPRTEAAPFGGFCDWCDILNAQVLGQDADQTAYHVGSEFNASVTLYGRQELIASESRGERNLSRYYARGLLMCPNFDLTQAWPSGTYRWPYAYNYDAAGGDGFGGLVPPSNPFIPSRYGKWVPPAELGAGTYAVYDFGATLGRFHSDQFLIVETDGVWHETGERPPINPPHTLTLDPTGYVPPYSSRGGGEYSFRHPYFKAANFLCFDCHVELLTPKSDIDDARLLSMPDSAPSP